MPSPLLKGEAGGVNVSCQRRGLRVALRFEKTQSRIYPAYLSVGGYSIALAPEGVTALKRHLQVDEDSFFEALLAQVGINHYLKEMIANAIAGENDKSSLAKRVREELATL